MIAAALTAAAIAGEVWIADPLFPGRALARVVHQAEKPGASAMPVAAGAWCLVFDDAADPEWVARAGKRLKTPLEARSDCAEARYPAGTGWLVAVIGADPELEERLDQVREGLWATVLARPMDGRPASFCVNGLQIDAARLRERLDAVNLDVRGIYDVGGCDARVHGR